MLAWEVEMCRIVTASDPPKDVEVPVLPLEVQDFIIICQYAFITRHIVAGIKEGLLTIDQVTPLPTDRAVAGLFTSTGAACCLQ